MAAIAVLEAPEPPEPPPKPVLDQVLISHDCNEYGVGRVARFKFGCIRLTNNNTVQAIKPGSAFSAHGNAISCPA